MMRGIKALMALALVVTAAMGVGCGSSGGAKYDVSVGLDPALMSAASVPTIAVHIFGANAQDEARWANESMTAYWMPGGQLRQDYSGQIKEFTFGPGATKSQMLSRNDPIWDAWAKRGADKLYIVANLPGAHEDKAGDADDRRVILPLSKDRWDAGQVIQIIASRARVQSVSVPKPVKQ